MSFGLKVINNSGFIQIDQDYQSYYVVEEGSISISKSGTYIAWPNDQLMVFNFESTPYYLSAQEWGVNGVKLYLTYPGTVTLYSGVIHYCKLRSDIHSNIGGGYGFQVRNSGGSAVFNSNDRFFAASTAGFIPNISTTKADVYAPSRSRPFAALGNMLGRYALYVTSLNNNMFELIPAFRYDGIYFSLLLSQPGSNYPYRTYTSPRRGANFIVGSIP